MITGFTRSVRRTCPAIALFGLESTGKTALAVSAGVWAEDNGTTPGWIITDRKTPNTIAERCAALKLPLPYMSDSFVKPDEAAEIIRADRWDLEGSAKKIMAVYTAIIERVLNAAAQLASAPEIDPVVIDVGTTVYDWMTYSYNAKKQDVGQQLKWGPPQLCWKDLCDGLEHKTVLITLWAREQWLAGKSTGLYIPDGPKTLGYTVTTQVRAVKDKHRKLRKLGDSLPDGGIWEEDDEDESARFSLDIWESQENSAVAGQTNVLSGKDVNFTSLMRLLGVD